MPQIGNWNKIGNSNLYLSPKYYMTEIVYQVNQNCKNFVYIVQVTDYTETIKPKNRMPCK